MSAAIVISAQAIQNRIGARGDRPLDALARECFLRADSEDCGWMLVTDDEIFRAGCGGLLLLTEGEERSRVEVELRMLEGLNAAMRGLPIDMAALVPDGFEALGLLAIFRSRKEKPAEVTP